MASTNCKSHTSLVLAIEDSIAISVEWEAIFKTVLYPFIDAVSTKYIAAGDKLVLPAFKKQLYSIVLYTNHSNSSIFHSNLSISKVFSSPAEVKTALANINLRRGQSHDNTEMGDFRVLKEVMSVCRRVFSRFNSLRKCHDQSQCANHLFIVMDNGVKSIDDSESMNELTTFEKDFESLKLEYGLCLSLLGLNLNVAEHVPPFLVKSNNLTFNSIKLSDRHSYEAWVAVNDVDIPVCSSVPNSTKNNRIESSPELKKSVVSILTSHSDGAAVDSPMTNNSVNDSEEAPPRKKLLVSPASTSGQMVSNVGPSESPVAISGVAAVNSPTHVAPLHPSATYLHQSQNQPMISSYNQNMGGAVSSSSHYVQSSPSKGGVLASNVSSAMSSSSIPLSVTQSSSMGANLMTTESAVYAANSNDQRNYQMMNQQSQMHQPRSQQNSVSYPMETSAATSMANSVGMNHPNVSRPGVPSINNQQQSLQQQQSLTMDVHSKSVVWSGVLKVKFNVNVDRSTVKAYRVNFLVDPQIPKSSRPATVEQWPNQGQLQFLSENSMSELKEFYDDAILLPCQFFSHSEDNRQSLEPVTDNDLLLKQLFDVHKNMIGCVSLSVFSAGSRPEGGVSNIRVVLIIKGARVTFSQNCPAIAIVPNKQDEFTQKLKDLVQRIRKAPTNEAACRALPQNRMTAATSNYQQMQSQASMVNNEGSNMLHNQPMQFQQSQQQPPSSMHLQNNPGEQPLNKLANLANNTGAMIGGGTNSSSLSNVHNTMNSSIGAAGKHVQVAVSSGGGGPHNNYIVTNQSQFVGGQGGSGGVPVKIQQQPPPGSLMGNKMNLGSQIYVSNHQQLPPQHPKMTAATSAMHGGAGGMPGHLVMTQNMQGGGGGNNNPGTIRAVPNNSSNLTIQQQQQQQLSQMSAYQVPQHGTFISNQGMVGAANQNSQRQHMAPQQGNQQGNVMNQGGAQGFPQPQQTAMNLHQQQQQQLHAARGGVTNMPLWANQQQPNAQMGSSMPPSYNTVTPVHIQDQQQQQQQHHAMNVNADTAASQIYSTDFIN